MELFRLDAAFADLDRVADVVEQCAGPVLLSCPDANTVVAAAALRERLRGPLGVWLEISDGYAATLCARDVKTLSWLIDLRHVVISAPEHVLAHAEVVRAMLTDEEINLTNEVGALVAAYNRPAPPRPVTVWAEVAMTLVADGTVLRATTSSTVAAGTLTAFS